MGELEKGSTFEPFTVTGERLGQLSHHRKKEKRKKKKKLRGEVKPKKRKKTKKPIPCAFQVCGQKSIFPKKESIVKLSRPKAHTPKKGQGLKEGNRKKKKACTITSWSTSKPKSPV